MLNRCLAIVLFAATATAHAGGFQVPDLGVRRTAMGSIVGRPDDAEAIYHNPAGLILQPGWNLYASFGAVFVDTEFQLQAWDQSDRFLGAQPGPDGYYPAVRPTLAKGVLPMIAVTGEILPNRLVLGASVYVANAQGGGFSPDGVTRYHLIDGYVVAPEAVLAAAYRVTDTLTLGASAGAIAFRIHGRRDVFPVVDGADLSKTTGMSPELVLDGSAIAPTWSLAAFGQPHPRVTWGATVFGRVDAQLEGPLQVTYSADAASPGDTLVGRQSTHQLVPWTFLAGSSVDVTPNIEVGADLRYWLYRQYRAQHTDVVGIFLVRELDTVKNYHDSWQTSGGVRVHGLAFAPRLEAMMGMHYDHTPAPSSTVTLDQPTFDHVGLHTGARWSVGRYRIGASWLHYWYLIPTVTDSMTAPASNFRGHGSNNIFTVSVEARL